MSSAPTERVEAEEPGREMEAAENSDEVGPRPFSELVKRSSDGVIEERRRGLLGEGGGGMATSLGTRARGVPVDEVRDEGMEGDE